MSADSTHLPLGAAKARKAGGWMGWFASRTRAVKSCRSAAPRPDWGRRREPIPGQLAPSRYAGLCGVLPKKRLDLGRTHGAGPQLRVGVVWRVSRSGQGGDRGAPRGDSAIAPTGGTGRNAGCSRVVMRTAEIALGRYRNPGYNQTA